jgi:hypothetical protein
MRINLNVFNGTFNCGSPYVLTHLLETVNASAWSASRARA